MKTLSTRENCLKLSVFLLPAENVVLVSKLSQRRSAKVSVMENEELFYNCNGLAEIKTG